VIKEGLGSGVVTDALVHVQFVQEIRQCLEA
jgi:hypothetical protein